MINLVRGRRSKRSLLAFVRTYWVLAALGLMVLGGAAWWFAGSPLFRLKTVAVGGLVRVSKADVLARAELDPRSNVWLMDRRAVERRIEAIPYVAAARVHRRFPADVRIDVTEREPSICLHDGAHRSYTLDPALRVLERGCAAPGIPTFTVQAPLDAAPGAFERDAQLLRLQSDAAALAAAGHRYRAFAEGAYGELVATLWDGITVRFARDADLGRAQSLIAPILAQLGPRAAYVRSVDLRAPTTPVVEYRENEPARGKPAYPQQ
ncbi:MAG: FtsQ-type POTRA domain-containing protein [Candidatus Eremiobacteraeota bacterium]|nr:FtsQ-type POTRA domain-containing protein [Candidatus Eremiobacteraeota bacterium]MBC5804154.1 FtsQ-type POTRA domain-containing protein [Candidatus Eremiobacteraeota bacterium]MBC5823028.1 FtsQ-type POTRA domain-containing protein [Candidatus Eremiobacteraeota bacterium]